MQAWPQGRSEHSPETCFYLGAGDKKEINAAQRLISMQKIDQGGGFTTSHHINHTSETIPYSFIKQPFIKELNTLGTVLLGARVTSENRTDTVSSPHGPLSLMRDGQWAVTGVTLPGCCGGTEEGQPTLT